MLNEGHSGTGLEPRLLFRRGILNRVERTLLSAKVLVRYFCVKDVYLVASFSS
jgi:hypothetical protein